MIEHDFEEKLDPDYIEEQMIVQLRKVVDSIGNPKPLHWVRTDNGRNVWIAHKHAVRLVKLHDELTVSGRSIFAPEINANKHRFKRKFVTEIQTTEGLKKYLRVLRDNDAVK